LSGHELLEPDEAALLRATLLNTALALVPRVVMAVMHTTTIRANITAYSTAVGPSSARKNRFTPLSHPYMEPPLSTFRTVTGAAVAATSPDLAEAGLFRKNFVGRKEEEPAR